MIATDFRKIRENLLLTAWVKMTCLCLLQIGFGIIFYKFIYFYPLAKSQPSIEISLQIGKCTGATESGTHGTQSRKYGKMEIDLG